MAREHGMAGAGGAGGAGSGGGAEGAGAERGSGCGGVIREAVRYTGRVQGVGFRATAAATASGFAVTGWVRNERDGSVVLEAQGTAWDVERFLEAIGERLARFIRGADRHGAMVVAGERGFVVRKE